MPIRFHVNAGPFTSQVNYMATIQLLSEQIHGSACTDPAINEKASDETSKLPYWLVNVPRNEWLAECPECLKSISDKDRGIIGTEDAAWHRMSWADVREVIKANRLDLFERMPSDLRRYIVYIDSIKRSHGSVMNFIVQERLKWNDLRPASEEPFGCPDDIKVLCNDWPYGIDSRIMHLVVWTKFDLAEDPKNGDLTDEARASIDRWVEQNVRSRVLADQVVWFKNWKSLKSVHAVEHFHVMLYNAGEDFISELTGGDIPMSQKV